LTDNRRFEDFRDKLREVISELEAFTEEFASEIDIIHGKLEQLAREVERLRSIVRSFLG